MNPGRLTGPFGKPEVLVPTARQAALFDHASIVGRGVPEAALMENAGQRAALIIEHLFPSGRVVALAGPGNNGGDALVCARALAAWGRDVMAVTVGNRPRREPVLHDWEIPRAGFDPVRPGAAEELGGMLTGAGVVVDGLLGTGIRGAPRPRHAAVMGMANRSGAPVVALDAPSGVDGSSGAVPGEAVRATVTVAFGWPKLGTLLHPGREWCGRIVAVEIGFPPPDGTDWARLATPGWAREVRPRRPAATHKYEVGAVAVVAGSAMPGAAVLSARAAFRCGAGLVRVCASGPAAAVLGELPEAIFVDSSDEDALLDAVRRSDALAIGPGLGTGGAARRQLELTLGARAQRPVVVDADALTLLARGAGGGVAKAVGPNAVVTPHPGEMAALTGRGAADVQRDRVATTRDFAAAHGVVTLFKGTPSLVADPDGGLLVGTREGGSSLAVAGMGDVLTGAIASFLAQGVAPLDAAGLALHVTGRAASAGGLGPALMPSDVVEAIPAVLADETEGGTDLPFPFVTFDQRRPA